MTLAHDSILQRLSFAVPRNPAAPTDELLEDILLSRSPEGVNPDLVRRVFDLTQRDGVSFLFRDDNLSTGLLVPGYARRQSAQANGFVAVFYPDKTTVSGLPFDAHVGSEMTVGMLLAAGRESYGPEFGKVVYKWGTSHGTSVKDHEAGFERHKMYWRLGEARGIAPVVLGRLADQVLAIRHGGWLFSIRGDQHG